MLQSRPFIQHILRNPRFSRRVISLLVDEAHCISHWGSGFRKKYGTLGIARAFLPRGTPVVAMTATLTARARRDIMSKLGFIKGASRFVNVGNDRSNVSIIVRACENHLNTYTDLNFIIPANITTLDEIPKTWIYVDNISDCEDIVDHLCDLLKRQLTSNLDTKDLDQTIRSYHAVHTLEYRQKAMESFRDGHMRIMVCTEAAGMVSQLLWLGDSQGLQYLREFQGCNIPDIEVVVQWKLPKTLSNWVQRAGRVARGRDRQGIAVLLVERSVYSTNLETRKDKATKVTPKTKSKPGSPAQKPATKKETKEYAVAHGLLRGGTSKDDRVPDSKALKLDPEDDDEGLRVFTQNTTCRRKLCASVFDSEHLITGTKYQIKANSAHILTFRNAYCRVL